MEFHNSLSLKFAHTDIPSTHLCQRFCSDLNLIELGMFPNSFEIGILIIPALQMVEQQIRKILFKARKVTSASTEDPLVNQGDRWGLGSYSK